MQSRLISLSVFARMIFSNFLNLDQKVCRIRKILLSVGRNSVKKAKKDYLIIFWTLPNKRSQNKLILNKETAIDVTTQATTKMLVLVN